MLQPAFFFTGDFAEASWVCFCDYAGVAIVRRYHTMISFRDHLEAPFLAVIESALEAATNVTEELLVVLERWQRPLLRSC